MKIFFLSDHIADIQSSPPWREWRQLFVYIFQCYLYFSGFNGWYVLKPLGDTNPTLHTQPLLLPTRHAQAPQGVQAQTSNSQAHSVPQLPPELSSNAASGFGNQAFLWYPHPFFLHDPKSKFRRQQCCVKANVASAGHWREQAVARIMDRCTRLKKRIQALGNKWN